MDVHAMTDDDCCQGESETVVVEDGWGWEYSHFVAADRTIIICNICLSTRSLFIYSWIIITDFRIILPNCGCDVWDEMSRLHVSIWRYVIQTKREYSSFSHSRDSEETAFRGKYLDRKEFVRRTPRIFLMNLLAYQHKIVVFPMLWIIYHIDYDSAYDYR